MLELWANPIFIGFLTLEVCLIGSFLVMGWGYHIVFPFACMMHLSPSKFKITILFRPLLPYVMILFFPKKKTYYIKNLINIIDSLTFLRLEFE
jgi:hypothetical protein